MTYSHKFPVAKSPAPIKPSISYVVEIVNPNTNESLNKQHSMLCNWEQVVTQVEADVARIVKSSQLAFRWKAVNDQSELGSGQFGFGNADLVKL